MLSGAEIFEGLIADEKVREEFCFPSENVKDYDSFDQENFEVKGEYVSIIILHCQFEEEEAWWEVEIKLHDNKWKVTYAEKEE